MNIEDLEQRLTQIKYTSDKTRDLKAEKAKLPAFRYAFNQACKLKGVPTPEEFWSIYQIDSMFNQPDKGIKARLWRAYPSFIREMHLQLLLKQYFTTVLWSAQLDREYGVDFLIIYKTKAFCIHTFVGTPRSKTERLHKERRHPEVDGIHLDLALDLRKGRAVGDFMLYSEEDIKELKAKMDKV